MQHIHTHYATYSYPPCYIFIHNNVNMLHIHTQHATYSYTIYKHNIATVIAATAMPKFTVTTASVAIMQPFYFSARFHHTMALSPHGAQFFLYKHLIVQ